jgi:tRNA N6-adenosine threonylcarbamoyltransferase
MVPDMLVLGIETSCDETAAAIVGDEGEGLARIRANVVFSQLAEHRPYGGIVPEIAARAHLERLDGLIAGALEEARIGFDDLDGVAATGGPGLIGGVIVGVTEAKAISLARGRPFIAVNHLEGHALSARLSDDVAFPFLLLLVSGGHCQLLAVEGIGRYRRLGTTLDDAAGEAFDKGAKLLGLGYPGGPAIERAARGGNAARVPLPRPMKGREGCHFSFAGLKTALRERVEAEGELDDRFKADAAASLQAAIGDCLLDRTEHALAMFRAAYPAGHTLVVAGGVAANEALRGRLAHLARRGGFAFVAPPPRLCTDNGAMIAWAGLERLKLGLVDGLDFAPRPRWPLDPEAAPAPGAGVKA